MVKGFKMNNNKWNKNALGYGKKTNSSSNDGWNKNALKYNPKNDLENSGLSKKNENYKNDHWNMIPLIIYVSYRFPINVGFLRPNTICFYHVFNLVM